MLIKKRNKKICALAFPFSCWLLVSCGNADLSRSRASDLIVADQRFTNSVTQLNWREGGDKEWYTAKGPVNHNVNTLVTNNGDSLSGASLRLLNPARRKLEQVTGIKGIETGLPSALGLRSADFTYTYDVPDALRPFVVTGGNGSALFQKYDDGWRVSEMQLHDDVASLLSPNEQATLGKLMRDGQNDYAKLLAESKTASKVLLRFDYCNGVDQRRQYRCAATASGEVTDVRVSAGTAVIYGPTDTRLMKFNVWYGDIPNVGVEGRIFAAVSYGYSVNVGNQTIYMDSRADADRLALVSEQALNTWRSKYGMLPSFR